MISQAAEYSLRAILCLANSDGKAITIQDLALRAKLPREYFAKVLQTLARAEIVTSQRGLGGGFVLARPASELTLWDVVSAVDPSRKVRQCPVGDVEHDKALCPLHRRISAAVGALEQVLRGSTIADLLREADQSVPCQHSSEEAAHV